MSTYINGQGGTITFNSVTRSVQDWSVTVNAEALDTTSTASSGWAENITGIKSWEGSLKFDWDTSATPLITFIPGTSASIILPVGNTANSFTGTARITSVAVDNPAKEVVTVTANFKGTAALTYPT